jgi:hypothetical protein
MELDLLSVKALAAIGALVLNHKETALKLMREDIFPNEEWIRKNAPANPDPDKEDVLITNWWTNGALEYRKEILRRLR